MRLSMPFNAALGNVNQTVTYTDPIEVNPENQLESLKALMAEIKNGQVKTLLMLGGNPAYTAPSDMDFGNAINACRCVSISASSMMRLRRCASGICRRHILWRPGAMRAPMTARSPSFSR